MRDLEAICGLSQTYLGTGISQMIQKCIKAIIIMSVINDTEVYQPTGSHEGTCLGHLANDHQELAVRVG